MLGQPRLEVCATHPGSRCGLLRKVSRNGARLVDEVCNPIVISGFSLLESGQIRPGHPVPLGAALLCECPPLGGLAQY